MEVVNTYIVKYKERRTLAILFELEDGTYIVKYECRWLGRETIEPIDTKIAVSLIK